MNKLLLMLSFTLTLFASEALFQKGEFKKAYPSFKKACLNNDAKACYRLGQMNELALGTNKSYTYAYKYYNMACDLKDDISCANLGKMYFLGLGTSKNIKKAEQLFKQACDKDIFEACDDYAYLYKKEYKKFKQEELLKACEGGVSNSCIELAQNINPIDGLKFYLRACSLGDVYGCQQGSNSYVISTEALKNIDEFTKISEEECDKNNSVACYSLANFYRYLNNVEQAEKYYNISCKLDNKESCTSLGILYMELKKVEDSVRNFEYSCDKLNDGFACARLGYIYEEGLSTQGMKIDKNLSKSKKYFQKSCELGFTKSCEK